MVMPRCGISFADVSLAALECRGNLTRTAKRLGVEASSLRVAVRREKLEHWFCSMHPFVGPSRSGSRSRPSRVTADQIIELAKDGYSQKDAAFLLGVSYSRMKFLVKELGLRDNFLSHGECISAGRLGYAR